MLADEDRVKKSQLIRMWKQRLQNLEPLKKTRPEYYEKQKKILEEASDYNPFSVNFSRDISTLKWESFFVVKMGSMELTH